MSIDYPRELNKEQLEVVMNAGGAALIIAGPGSGKTRTLVYRVCHLLDAGSPPDSILLLTFTNKAAREMKKRVLDLAGKEGKNPERMIAGTFHHFCNLLLRRHCAEVGLKPNFTILDSEDSKSLLRRAVLAEYETVKKGVVETIASAISLSKLRMEPLEEVLESPDYFHLRRQADEICRIAENYGKAKLEMGSVDFNDLLAFVYIILRDNELIRSRYQNQFAHILVDEFQDTDRLQASIVRLLHKKGNGLLVVGDDAQSIYSFRGAQIQNILEFEKEFGAKIFYLVSNYRSTSHIVEMVNASMKKSIQKLEKNLVSLKAGSEKPILIDVANREEEAMVMGERIKSDLVAGRSVGVLFRAAYYASELELYLARNSIEYEMRGGLKFFEQAHIKDMIALLRSFHNPRDITAVSRLLLLFPRIGEKGVEKVLPEIKEAKDISAALLKLEPGKRGFASNAETLARIFDSKTNAAGMLNGFYESFYRNYLKENFEDHAERSPDIDALVGAAAKYPSVQEFLDALSLDAHAEDQTDAKSADTNPSTQNPKPGTENPKPKTKLVLSTIHQAKGLEWDSVYIICLADGLLPLARATDIEEERRLFYVAISRAKDRLVMSCPAQSGRFYDFNVLGPSRFLLEIPQELYERHS